MAEASHPLAIAMWDFSWLERRWPGAGFEDWDRALDELCARGYDAVRIDAFPHLIASDPDREWTLLPVWSANDWGSPYKNRVRPYPALLSFLEKCRARRVKVALSTWYREDAEDVRMRLATPGRMADAWLAVLRLVEAAGLLDTVLYVDLCNEWPGDFWAPFFENDPPWMTWSCWHTDRSVRHMRAAIEPLRAAYPQLPLCFSFDGWDVGHYQDTDLSFFDLIEHHIWMAKLEGQAFYRELGKADNPRFTDSAYRLLSDRAQAVYGARPDHWQGLLVRGIQDLAAAGRAAGKPLATTECWGIVDYKDYPLLSWGWVKALCALGVETAVATGQWALIATSNFAAPQFRGMWRDVAWHRALTGRIHAAPLPAALAGTPLSRTMAWA